MTETADSPRAKFSDYLELTKPRLSLLSVLTALVGYLAARPPQDLTRLLLLALGTSLAAGGVATLNQWLESETDARMKRTAERPIPTGKVAAGSAFVLGWLMCIAALFLLFARVNALSALFTLLTIVSYLGWYTPAKRNSRWSTEIGAIAGAFPPLIGWAAAEGHISTLGWVLFGVLFFWQIPHFMAIAWTYRHDYSTVNFPMLPVRDEAGGRVAAWSLINTVLLVITSLLPVAFGLATSVYAAAAVGCGGWFLWRAIGFLRAEFRDFAARKLFFTSIVYLPLVLGALVIDRIFFLPRAMSVNDIPTLNATLNGIATVLLTIGFLLIKRGRRETHRKVMTAACMVSAVFLVGYVTHKILIRGVHTPFGGIGLIRTVYYAMLISHIILAMSIAYLVPRTFLFAIRGDFVRHRAWAKWTFPIWYYVSITGVLVYFFLYQWWPVTKTATAPF